MSTIAKINVTLQIEANSNWNDDTLVSQVKKQAIEDALGFLNKNINSIDRMKIIGEPKVTIVTFDV